MRERTTRRALLRTGAGALAAGLTTGGAGCQSPLGDGGADSGRSSPTTGGATVDRDGAAATTDGPSAVTLPAVDPPWYRRWLPAYESPDGAYDVFLAIASFVDHDRLAAVGGALHPETERGVRAAAGRMRDYLGLDAAAIARAAQLGVRTVLVEGAFARERPVETLLGSGYAREGTHAGYDVLGRDDVRRVALVTDGRVVWSMGDAAGALARAVVDAGRGEHPRAVDEFDALGPVTDRLGAGLAGIAVAYPLTQQRLPPAFGLTLAARDRLYRHAVVRPRDGAIVNPVDAVPFVDRGPFTDRQLVTDPPLVAERASAPLDAAYTLGGSEGPLRPLVTWSFAHDPRREVVTVTHAAGEPVPTARLEISAGDLRGRVSDLDGVGATLEPGDSFSVPAPEDREVVLSWAPGNGSVRAFEY